MGKGDADLWVSTLLQPFAGPAKAESAVREKRSKDKTKLEEIENQQVIDNLKGQLQIITENYPEVVRTRLYNKIQKVIATRLDAKEKAAKIQEIFSKTFKNYAEANKGEYTALKKVDYDQYDNVLKSFKKDSSTEEIANYINEILAEKTGSWSWFGNNLADESMAAIIIPHIIKRVKNRNETYPVAFENVITHLFKGMEDKGTDLNILQHLKGAS